MRKFIIYGLVLCFSSLPVMAMTTFTDKNTGLVGIKDSGGKTIAPAQYDQVFLNSDSTLIDVIKAGQFLRLDMSGKVKFESMLYDNGHDYYQEGLARFVEKGRIGFHDAQGDVVIKADYDFAFPFEEGVSIVCRGCWAQFDKNPKFKAASSSTCLRPLDQEYKTVVGGQWGAIDTSGKIQIPLELNSRQAVADRIASK